METLRGSYSKWFSYKYRERNRIFLGLRDDLVGRAEIRLLRTPLKHINESFSLSISLPHKIIEPVLLFSSLSSSDTQVDDENEELLLEETQINDTNEVKTVHVKFQLQRECSFGQQFLLVGDDPILGLWDPEDAIPLNWSDGHVWTVEMDIPIGKPIKFKFIMKEDAENILWQPGPDRIIETWETKKTITVCEDWDNAEFQMIIEEEPTSNQTEGSTIIPETLLIAENLAEPKITREPATINGIPDVMEKPFAEKPEAIIAENSAVRLVTVESVSTDGSPDVMELPFVEKPKAINAENITEAKEKLPVNTNNTEKKGPIAISNKNMEAGGSVLGNNGRSVNVKDFSSQNNEGNLVSYEGVPVLVPGLTPLPTAHTDDESMNEAPISPVGADKAKDLKQPELEPEEEHDNSHLKGRSEILFNGTQELDKKEQPETPDLIQEQDQPNTNSFDNVLDNDMQWGRKTLQKLLNGLGIR